MAIISHRHKFIFLKTRKTASGTCELVLGRYCGPQDILVPTKDGGDVGVLEQNNTKPVLSVRAPELRKIRRRCTKNLRNGRGPKIRREFRRARRIISGQHAGAREIKEVVGESVWDSYYTFCFERNPFDRLVSFYHWRTKILDEKPAFEDFAWAVLDGDRARQDLMNARAFSNLGHYTIGGDVVVDKVYPFENLEPSLNDVFERLNIPWDGWLPHTKGNIRPKRSYRDYYTPELRLACEKAFSFELELLGYDF